MDKIKDVSKDSIHEPIDNTKRESLIKMGKRTAYLSPVVITLLTSNKASALSPPPPP